MRFSWHSEQLATSSSSWRPTNSTSHLATSSASSTAMCFYFITHRCTDGILESRVLSRDASSHVLVSSSWLSISTCLILWSVELVRIVLVLCRAFFALPGACPVRYWRSVVSSSKHSSYQSHAAETWTLLALLAVDIKSQEASYYIDIWRYKKTPTQLFSPRRTL